MGRLTPAGLCDAWVAEHNDAEAPIERDTVLERVAPIAWRRGKDDDGEAVLVVTHGDEVLATLSAHAEPFVRALSKSTRFRASDAAAWEPSIPWDDVAMLLGEFASLGVLARAAG